MPQNPCLSLRTEPSFEGSSTIYNSNHRIKQMTYFKIVFLFIITSLIECCSSIAASKEAVLKPNEIALCKTSKGRTMTIEALTDTTRVFSSSSWTKRVEMDVRSERWFGTLGLYSAGDAWAFRPNEVMLIGNEAQMFFPDNESALRWIREGTSEDRSYTSNGLVFSMEEGKGPGPIVRVVHFELFKIFVAGKPAHLPGGNSSVVRITPH